MAISSPPVPSLFPLSTIFSHERRRTIQLKASLDFRVPSNPQPKIKRQNHLHKKLSVTDSSSDFSANQPIEADLEVPIDERSNKEFVVAHELDSFGVSKGGVEKEGTEHAALQMHIEESSNSQILVSEEVDVNQIPSEIRECSRTNGMVSEEVHQLECSVREEGRIDPFGSPTFGLALRIGALLLAQAIFSILFFSLGGFMKERREKEVKKKKREKYFGGEVRERHVMDELEYGSKVTEIRTMASLARQIEKRDAEAKERGGRNMKNCLDESGSLNLNSFTDLGKKELNRAGEVQILQSDFGNEDAIDEFDDCRGNVKTEEKPAGRMQMHSVPREETDQSSKGLTCLNIEEQSKNNHQDHNSNNGSTNQIIESKVSFSKRVHLNGNGEVTGEEPRWYRLPCVLGILLCGGESDGAPGGLYSLEIEPNSTNRYPMSYAITFQDRVDATHCCYVLGTFFEDLDNVSADIVPLTTQELKEEVQSGRLNVIVIPKGKLKLYVGQPLEEVEIALRSFVN